jgi:hypothetical protein
VPAHHAVAAHHGVPAHHGVAAHHGAVAPVTPAIFATVMPVALFGARGGFRVRHIGGRSGWRRRQQGTGGDNF